MGTEIDLRVGPVMVDWSKNNRGADHGVLFQEGNRERVRSDQTDYDYCEQHDIDTAPAERALVRSLKSTVPRLELLGFTVDAAKREYEGRVAEWLEYQEDESASSVLPFSEFIEFLARHPLNSLDDTYATEFDGSRSPRFAEDQALFRIPTTERGGGYSEASYFGSLITILHPYAVLRLLALVPENETADVTWHYGPMVESGWAEEQDFSPGARRTQTFLIATEGSS